MNASDEARQWAVAAAEKIVREIDPPAEQPDGQVIVRGVVLVVDVMHPDDGRQMYLVSTNPSGSPLAEWETDGLLHYALHDYVPMDEPEDDG